MSTVLVIEDEKELANVLKAYLERSGYEVLMAFRGDQGLTLWETHKPDMVLLDLNLPGIDGIDIARQIRQEGDTPIIMVTARVEEVDRLLGLELGADDYITKPFSPREVVARVKAVLRRVEKAPVDTQKIIKIDDLEIDQESHTINQAGETLDLTPTEFDLLSTMVIQPGRAFSRLQLLEAIQGMAYEGYERSIDAHIKNLRAKLGDDSKSPRYIETVFGIGYRFKKGKKMSMRWRLLGAFALVIIIALGTIAVVTRYTTEQEVQRFLGYGGQVGLENLARTLENYYADNGAWSGIFSSSEARPGRGQGQRGSGMAGIGSHILVDASGVVVYSPREDEIGMQLSDQQLSQTINLEVSGDVVGYLLPEGGIPELPDNFEGLLIERVNRATLLAALVSGGIAILLALVLATLILKPVRDLTTAASKMSAGDLSQRVEAQGKGEIHALGQTFNKMAESLQDAEVRRRAMTADIAHELRNPLAIQRAHLEALQDGVYPLNSESLEPIAEQNQQLTRLVEDLRTLALADAGSLELNKRKIDLIEVCLDTVKRFEPQTLGKNIKLFTDCQLEGLLVEADKERLQQILDNLMQNAIRYTPEAGWIRLSLLGETGFGMFKIHNNGPQLSEQALNRLFERFYRAEKARDRASGGTGLGLAIARQLAEAHGGSLDGANHPEGGVVFTLTLPLIPG